MDNQIIESIIYKESYVAFLDVLGFKELVLRDNTENRKRLNQYFNIVNSVINYIRSIDMKKDIGFIVISDSIIMSIHKGNSNVERLDRLRSLCIAVGLIQKRLALIDIWLRGGISSGKAYFNIEKNQIVGPAYINAYLLEESMAVFPRVLLDSKVINELGYSSASDLIDAINMSRDGGLEFYNWGSAILYNWHYPDGKSVTHLKQDVALFIDYLCPIVEEDTHELLTIIGNIEKSIYSDTRIYTKFRWVSDYLKSIALREQKNDNVIGDEAMYRLENL
ncbi:hypothetical protein [Clostridium tagluense]|uniref:hypothetical protein n=1 Tax=Clostridium tagluense TaxID=360422 RepID=UPI001C0DF6E5|nr:hypothetical protein [Clostridium tagluense]MBU3130556.1 hypothetical protein [Clostridium tagluense]